MPVIDSHSVKQFYWFRLGNVTVSTALLGSLSALTKRKRLSDAIAGVAIWRCLNHT